MIGLLFLVLSACATTQPPRQQVSVLPVEQPVQQPSLAETMHDHHYVGWFHNDRRRKSYPTVLQIEPIQGDGKDWQLHAVLRIFTPDNSRSENTDSISNTVANDKIISSFYPDVQLRDGKQLIFTKGKQKITVVGKGKLQSDGSVNIFAVIYGFGQGELHLQRQAISSYTLPNTSKYPLALTKINMNYTKFPQQVFVQQQLPADNNKLLEDSKNILSSSLYGANYKLRTKLGVYYGVLHHEYHNRFQYLRLQLSGNDQQNTLTASNTLFFSLPQNREFIVYRYVNSISADKLPTVLSGRGDNFLKVNKWDSDKIEALWYSKSHGRIGRVYLQRNSFPQLPKEAKIISALAGNYSNANYSCNIKVNNKTAEDVSIYPSAVHGVVRDISSRKNHLISFGRYDFYRGNVEITYNGKLMRYALQQTEFNPTITNNKLKVGLGLTEQAKK